MGPSGSGKTSLVSVAAGLTKPGDVEGSIRCNGEEGNIPKRLVGVVWQDDLLLSNLTVEETIFFSARLKTPIKVSDDDVWEVVQETIEELGLSHVRTSLVGSPVTNVRGISGGERKRVAVAAELVVRPSLLVLDEPTSGLDATTAQNLVATLKELANLGHAIAVVIHQPRTAIYSMCDHLLLLSNGRVIFDGPAVEARVHLESCPTVPRLPPETGIADWMMDVVILDEQKAGGGVLANYWEKMKTSINETSEPVAKVMARKMSSLRELNAIPKFETGFTTQLKLLTQRTVKQQRGERLTRVSALLTLVYIVFTAIFWWRLPNDTGHAYDRNSLLFFMIIAQSNGIVVNSISAFQRERALLRRERAKKMYGVLPYFLAKTLSDMTNNVLLPTLYGVISYWVANFRPEFVHFLQFVLAFYLTLAAAQSMGLFLSVAIPSMQIALILAPPLTLFFMIMGGFYIPLNNFRPWIKWLSWLSFARYGYSALLLNEFYGRDIPCAGGPTSIAIGNTGECPLPGDSITSSLGITGVSTSYWFNIGMIIALQVAFRVGSYYVLRRSK